MSFMRKKHLSDSIKLSALLTNNERAHLTTNISLTLRNRKMSNTSSTALTKVSDFLDEK